MTKSQEKAIARNQFLAQEIIVSLEHEFGIDAAYPATKHALALYEAIKLLAK